MGDLTAQIMDGDICASCMMSFLKAHGHPALCRECKADDPDSSYPVALHRVLTWRDLNADGTVKRRATAQ